MTMSSLRLVLILFLLLTASSTINMFASEIEQTHWNYDVEGQISEDLSELSPSHLSALPDIFKIRPGFSSKTFISEESSRSFSKSKAYFSSNRFIEPGLSKSDLIFPFHIFL